MRKLIAAMNMTLDGYCDHTAMIADNEIHEHYNELLRSGDILIYGRTTYQLMESHWPTVVKNPTGNKPVDAFAVLIDNISKIVFSRELKDDDPTITGWKNARLAKKSVKDELADLKLQPGKDILVGSPSLIAASLNLNLVDEFQISVQPTILGKGLSLFKDINDRINFKLVTTKTFGCGAVTFYFEPIKN
jgi:dihydrofolate reductase